MDFRPVRLSYQPHALALSNTPGPIEVGAEAIAAAGAFAVVIEAVVEPLARHISAKIAIPTIGIGASPACNGQILVLDDMFGMTDRTARFVERFANVRSIMNVGIAAFSSAVRDGSVPKQSNLHGVKA